MRTASARRERATGLALASLLAAGALVLTPAAVLAGATAPVLVLSAASGAVAGGARTVVLEGAFDFPNAVQVGYPLHILVFQGARFARYPVAGAAVVGESPVLGDGLLAEGELPVLLAAGAPAPPGVRLVTLRLDRATVTLPAEFTAGPATAVVFAVLPEGNVLSNPIGLVLP